MAAEITAIDLGKGKELISEQVANFIKLQTAIIEQAAWMKIRRSLRLNKTPLQKVAV